MYVIRLQIYYFFIGFIMSIPPGNKLFEALIDVDLECCFGVLFIPFLLSLDCGLKWVFSTAHKYVYFVSVSLFLILILSLLNHNKLKNIWMVGKMFYCDIFLKICLKIKFFFRTDFNIPNKYFHFGIC